MALASATPFASFDINANTNVLDISSMLEEALYLDFDFLSQGLNFDLGNPVNDTTFYWNQEALNSNTATVSGSITSVATSISVSTGHGARFHIGDTFYVVGANTTEVIEVTAISTDTLTIVRAVNSTTAASIADAATVSIMPAYQEGSDIGSDKSVKPTALSNYTQIVSPGDLLITGSQLARQMATVALDVNRQLANRMIELKRYWTSICLYGEKSASAGSDTVYRKTLGMRGWIRDNSGVTSSTSEALSWSVLNTHNKTLVDTGQYPDTLLIGTDLVGSIAGIDSSLRRLLETDTKAGYTVNQILLAQGNTVNVVVDGRVKTGDAFLYKKDKVSWRPLNGRGAFTIDAVDFTDGVKRRVLSEGGVEFRNPGSAAYLSNRT